MGSLMGSFDTHNLPTDPIKIKLMGTLRICLPFTCWVKVMARECLEMIDDLKEEAVHNDLLVGMTSSHSVVKSSWTNSLGMNWGRRSTRSFVLE